METLSKVFEDKYNKNVKDCTNEEIYHGLLSWTKEQLKGRGYQEGKKKIYYISAEFLIGKLLSNNLINLGVYDEVAKYLKENGKDRGDRAGAISRKRRTWSSGSMLPGFHRNSGTSGRRNRT